MDGNNSFMDMLNSASVDLDSTPLGDFIYDETDGGVEGGAEDDDDEVEEVDAPKHGVNYTVVEDETLIRAWESMSLDSIHGTDQARSRFWQRVEDKYFQLLPRNAKRVSRTFRSLQGRWDVIKTTCSRWSGCLQQVHNAPPSGTVEGDWVSFIVVL